MVLSISFSFNITVTNASDKLELECILSDHIWGLCCPDSLHLNLAIHWKIWGNQKSNGHGNIEASIPITASKSFPFTNQSHCPEKAGVIARFCYIPATRCSILEHKT